MFVWCHLYEALLPNQFRSKICKEWKMENDHWFHICGTKSRLIQLLVSNDLVIRLAWLLFKLEGPRNPKNELRHVAPGFKEERFCILHFWSWAIPNPKVENLNFDHQWLASILLLWLLNALCAFIASTVTWGKWMNALGQFGLKLKHTSLNTSCGTFVQTCTQALNSLVGEKGKWFG